ncbi:HesB/IscA family protein [Candidatus Hepatobacter penaei]|uniref:HesB/IscA family protein n=1 Tax=Candidatus Hepatobacter penaei TaxID=1274402 RepID=UPI0004F2BB50|nr:iron-sulfur cluster assembly accessory protein [Candidatus Hepatobacter penaei]TGW14929.1 iron-sulfur cluster assembly accessory protein [bacterium NHP-B]
MRFSISDAAQKKLKDLGPEKGLFRVRVDPGGCFGFQYAFSFDQPHEDDLVVEGQGGIKVLVDKLSASFLDEAELDHKEEMIGSTFVINNPHAKNACGCKNSFSF